MRIQQHLKCRSRIYVGSFLAIIFASTLTGCSVPEQPRISAFKSTDTAVNPSRLLTTPRKNQQASLPAQFVQHSFFLQVQAFHSEILLPDLTPGSLCTESDSHFLELRYQEQIPVCKRSVSRGLKLRVAQAYGIAEEDFSNFEFDHYIPLSLGGSNNEDNLWPEPRDDGNAGGKDKLEYRLYRDLAAGEITQSEAIDAIRSWAQGQY